MDDLTDDVTDEFTLEITSEPHVGIDGLAPHPLPGLITHLRVLHTGMQIDLAGDWSELRLGRGSPPAVDVQIDDESVSEVHARLRRTADGSLELRNLSSRHGIAHEYGWRHGVGRMLLNAGERFSIGNVGMVGLDAVTASMAADLAAWGAGTNKQITEALFAAMDGHALVVHAASIEQVDRIVRRLHVGSKYRDFPLTVLRKRDVLEGDAYQLCAAMGFGTAAIDLTDPYTLPGQFATNLLTGRFHVWPIVVARTCEDVWNAFADTDDQAIQEFQWSRVRSLRALVLGGAWLGEALPAESDN